jgi:transposase-like protein
MPDARRRRASRTTRGPPLHFIPGTNLIESINARLRKVTRNRGQFPSEQAVLKVLYLAVRNLEEFRRPNVGIRSSGWKQALQAFTIYFQGRIPTP